MIKINKKVTQEEITNKMKKIWFEIKGPKDYDI